MRCPALALTLTLVLAGCGVDSHAFVCETDVQCGTSGRCEPEGFCSVADATCSETGFRFVESSEPSLAGTCTRVCADAVFAGGDVTCVRLMDGTVQCAGANATGQLGRGVVDPSPQVLPGPVGGIFAGRTFTQIALGGGHACGRGSDGMVSCWGKNTSRQASSSASEIELAPVTIMAADAVAAGRDHTCAQVSGGARCWGSNVIGQLGSDDLGVVHQDPVVVKHSTQNLSSVSRIASSAVSDFTCVSASGVGCWGANEGGQLGEGAVEPRDYYTPMGGLTGGALPLAIGRQHGCVAQREATPGVECWGDNGAGQLGNPSSAAHQVPTPVVSLGDVTHLAAKETATCAVLAASGDVMCFGDGSFEPQQIEGVTGATSLAAGRAHVCAIAGGRVLCWGDNSFGQLGDGTTTARTVPTVARLVCPRD